MQESPSLNRIFVFACVFESGLFVLALALGWGMDLKWWTGLAHLKGLNLFYAVLAAVPMLGFFQQMLFTNWEPFMEIRRFLDGHLRPMFQEWEWWRFGLLSFCAGCGEEALFRGVIQGRLTDAIGPIAALLVSGILFGLLHFMTPAYFWIATFIGVYLGSLWMLTQSLWVPILTHGLYDFAALYYFIRMVPKTTAAAPEKTDNDS